MSLGERVLVALFGCGLYFVPSALLILGAETFAHRPSVGALLLLLAAVSFLVFLKASQATTDMRPHTVTPGDLTSS